MLRHRVFLLVIILLSPVLLRAQVNPQDNNPYSAFGLGDLQTSSSIRNLGMAGTGVASYNADFINFQNPALLSRSRIRYHIVEHNENVSTIAKTYGVSEEEIRSLNNIIDEAKEGQKIRIPVRKYTFWEAAANVGYRHVQNPTKNYSANLIGFQYFCFSFPIQQRITLAGGLLPFSKAGFKNTTVETIAGGFQSKTFDRKDGGINQVFLAGGYDINKNFSLGLQGGFLFGKITGEHFLEVPIDSNGQLGTVQASSYKALLVKPGIFFRSKLNKYATEDSIVYINAGLTYEYLGAGGAKTIQSHQIRDIFNGIISDTILSNIKQDITLPFTIAGGLALNKPGKWTIEADFSYSKWSAAKNIDSGTVFRDSYRASLGIEWKTRGKKDISSSKKTILRSGLAWRTLPYVIDGQTVNEYSASIGASFPMGKINVTDKNQPLTKINIGITGGLIGDKSLSTGKELFVKGYFGILINDKWFKRRRIQ